MKCVLCEAGHVDHPHWVGVEAICGYCKKPGMVVATNAENHDAILEKATKTPLEVSGCPPHYLTCRDCEILHFKNALPKRGVCPECGKAKTDSLMKDPGFASSFCDDACRSAWATKQARA